MIELAEGQRLRGKVALITGAANGIGKATALRFAREGAAVGLFDRDAAALKALAGEIKQSGLPVLEVVGDVTNAADIAAIAEEMRQRFGPVNVLVNNAGITHTAPFLDTKGDDVDRLVAVNLKGLIAASQAIIPQMKEAGGGSIVHDASNAGLVGRPWQSVYGATKAGVVSLTKSMALAYARDSIRVNCVCPGSIDTPMLRGALATAGDFDQNWRRTARVIPLGRIGKADDIAYATLFLASDEAGYITGVALPVDGGRVAGVPEVAHLLMDQD